MARDKAGNSLRASNKTAFGNLRGGGSSRITDFVGESDGDDIYRVRLGRRSRFTLRLSSLQANANVALFQLKGNALTSIGRQAFSSLSASQIRRFIDFKGQGRRKGNAPETLARTLNAGTYYVRVYPATRRVNTRYALRLTARQILPTPTPPVFTQQWIKQLGSSQNDYAYGIGVDSASNIYVVGTTEGALPGQTSAGAADAFMTQYSSSGDRQWIRQLGSSTRDAFSSLAIDSNDQIYAAGVTKFTVPSLSPFSTGSGNGYLVKYNAAGNALWTQPSEYDDGGIEAAAGVAVTSNGVYMAGGAAKISFNSSSDAFVARYGTNGTGPSSVIEGFAAAQSAATQMVADSAGNLYVTGIASASFVFDPNDPLQNGNAFVAKYDSSGSQVWLKTLSSSGTDYSRGIAVDGQGNVYIAGETAGSLPGQTSAGGLDAFVAKYSSSGDRQWVQQFGVAGDDSAQGIAVDSAGKIYLTGETNGALFGNQVGGSDAWLAVYNSSGSRLAAKQIGTTADDEAYGITVDGSGNIYLTGQTFGSFDGLNQGSYDVWIAKYGLS